MQNADTVYQTICSYMEKEGYRFDRHDDDRVVSFTGKGEDLPIRMLFFVFEDPCVVYLKSKLPINVKEDKRMEMAIAIAMINYKLREGSFNLSLTEGEIVFRLTNMYQDSLISESLIDHMFGVTAYTVDEYNDKLLALATGMIDFKKFSEMI